MEYYVICTRDCELNKLVYYTGKESFYGGSLYSNVLDALKFNSLKEAALFIADNVNEFYLGANIINIPDVTFNALKLSFETDKKLYEKYHNPNYAIR